MGLCGCNAVMVHWGSGHVIVYPRMLMDAPRTCIYGLEMLIVVVEIEIKLRCHNRVCNFCTAATDV